MSLMGRSLLAAFLMSLSACAGTTHVVTGAPRPALSASEVKLYSRPPPAFQEIAQLDASASHFLGPGGQKSVDKVIAQLKEEAAKLGANGLILEGFEDRQSGSIGSGMGSDSYSNHSAVGVGVGGSVGIYKKTGHAVAIFVPTETPPPVPPP
jgi:hypothetical protein